MTITTPSAPVVVTEADLLLPAADADPLQTILENANHAWAHYAPPLLVGVYTVESGLTRNAVFQVPIVPSSDGLTYRFEHHALTGTGTGNLGVTVEEWTGSWSTIHTTTTIAAAASSWVEYRHTATISASATKLRMTYTRAGSDPYTPHSVTIYPEPGNATTGTQSSGFEAFDDGLLAATGAPITTEHVNRAATNMHALMRDRRQCVAAFIQEDDSTPSNVLHDVGNATHATAADVRVLYGRAVATLPYQTEAAIDVYCIATHDHTSASNVVRFGQANGGEVAFNADGTIESDTLTLYLDRAGALDAGAELVLQGSIPAAAQTTYIHAVVAYWRPGD